MIDYSIILIAWVFMGTVALAFAIDRTRISRYFPGPLALIFISVALTNLGVLPRDAPVYGWIAEISVPVGVALLLLRANIPEIIRKGGPMLGHYAIGISGSVVGISIAVLIFDFGAGEGELAATLLALCVGSAVNMIAVAQALRLEPTLFSALFTSGVVVGPMYFAFVLVLMRTKWVGNFVRCPAGATYEPLESKGAQQRPSPDEQRPSPAPLGQLFSLLYAFGVFMLVGYVMDALGYPHLSVLVVTVIALLVGNFLKPVRQAMSGDRELGLIFLYLFICALSAQVDLSALGYLAGWVMLFWATVISIHLVILLTVGRMLRADPHLLLLASLAGLGGPTSTAAMAASIDREDLVTPGILCALGGIVIGTFIGIGWFGLFG